MKLHTSLTYIEVMDALDTVKNLGRVGTDVVFFGFDTEGSRSHRYGYVFHLASEDRPGRRRVNSGWYGAGEWYAARYDEWGWFMAEVYALDPGAKWSCGYVGSADFHTKTQGRFRAEAAGVPGQDVWAAGPSPLSWDKPADPVVFGGY